MLRFFFKKNLYDGWDNVLYFFVPNLILDAFILVFGVLAFFVTKMPDSAAGAGVLIWALCALVVTVALSIIALTWAESAAEIADYGIPEVRDFFKNIKSCVKDGLKYGFLLYFVAIAAIVGSIFYLKPQFDARVSAQKNRIEQELSDSEVDSAGIEKVLADENASVEKNISPVETVSSGDDISLGETVPSHETVSSGEDISLEKTNEQGSFIGLLAGYMFLVITISIFMGLFWYPAMRSLLHNSFGKCLKKCFVILFDNPGKSFVIGVYNLFLFLISVVLLGLAPGLAGIVLSRENALYLLLKKYDYLDALDEQKEPANSPKRKIIPWREILSDDIEATGTRGFKGFFMPWKELEAQGAKEVKKPKDDAELEIDEKWREE